MFSFHKPKVYRSTKGCCICKAKSSSSRFTDSKKYEEDTIECFQLASPRCGEICNACVLLVKRFKRLPPGSERHWSHVVDARIGPGIKSMNKFKKRKEEQQNGTIVGYAKEFAGQSETNAQNMNNGNGIHLPERLGHFLNNTKKKLSKESATVVVAAIESVSDENSEPNTQCEIELRLKVDADVASIIGTIFPEHFNQQSRDIGTQSARKMRRRKSYRPLKNRNKYVNHTTDIIDLDVWIKVKSCCGYVYENPAIGALLIDVPNLTPYGCAMHKRETHMTVMKAPNNATIVVAQMPKKSLKSLPLKKQHSLGKRYIEQTDLIEIDPSNPTTNHKFPLKSKNANANAQKTKTEISNETNLSTKSAARQCTDKSQIMRMTANVANQNDTNVKRSNKLIDVLSVTKFSDNSSDSGYDETLHDTAQLNQIAKIGASRPVILSNGVKIHVQPQNLLLAANLAGVSQTAIQSTQANMQATLMCQQKAQLEQTKQPIRGTNAITNAFI